ncbi:hypothetical protein B4U80_06533 [Leptotrombidium deliense]|uniref:Ig-like domain-containing protein n=1 Tax=Leptotrombidium deliense TaxID=299467 RepID=A0A443SII3_9ACAR|nr:hypothetical protein B4U80_06533 [Leptotrombidium deliense]
MTISRLIISDARSSDSGNYSCKLSQFVNSGVVTVHVLNGGENPAAMQHGKNSENNVSGNANNASSLLTPFMKDSESAPE